MTPVKACIILKHSRLYSRLRLLSFVLYKYTQELTDLLTRKTSNRSPRLVLVQMTLTPGFYSRPGLYLRPGFYQYKLLYPRPLFGTRLLFETRPLFKTLFLHQHPADIIMLRDFAIALESARFKISGRISLFGHVARRRVRSGKLYIAIISI